MAQHPVDAIADLQAIFIGLDVNVGGPLADRLQHQIVDELDDAGGLGLLQLLRFGPCDLGLGDFDLSG